MNNDLISRSALKNAVEKRIWYIAPAYDEIMSIIDNAPAVDTYTIEDIKEVQEKSLILGAKLAQRPKGEWIIIDDCEKFIAKCSICGRIEDSRMVKDYPFCHCGANMKGGAEYDK